MIMMPAIISTVISAQMGATTTRMMQTANRLPSRTPSYRRGSSLPLIHLDLELPKAEPKPEPKPEPVAQEPDSTWVLVAVFFGTLLAGMALMMTR